MYVFLLLVGLLMTAAGFVAIGFGIPINALASLGNTLILSGTSLVSGGLVLVGLAVVVRQLQRMNAALASQPPKPPAKPVEAPGPLVPPTARMSTSPAVGANPARLGEPRGSESRSFETRPPEPRAQETREVETRTPEPQGSERQPSNASPAPPESRGPLSWLRSKPRSAAGDAPPIADVPAEASPRAGVQPPSEPAEPRAWSPARDDDAARPEPPAEPRAERPVRTAPASEHPKDSGLFDVDWPPKSGTAAPADGGRREQSRNISPRTRQEPSAERRGAQAAPAPERTPAILKSGVIDGMAYTLYADGSIEAELPQGTLTFASVDALRAHLEKHGG